VINIKEGMSVDIKIGNILFTKLNFILLKIVQEADNIIPQFELQLTMFDPSILPEIKKNNAIINIGWGRSNSDVTLKKWRIKSYQFQPDEDKYSVKLTGILDVIGYTNQIKITSVKDTSDKILKAITTLTPDINWIGKDKQYWLRHNIPEKEFVDRVVSNAFLAKDDLPIVAVNIDSKLIGVSVKKKFGEEPKQIFTNRKVDEDTSKIRFTSYSLEGDSSIFKYMFSEGTVTNVYDFNKGSMKDYSSNQKSMVDGKDYEEVTYSRESPPLIDCGNCHDDYYQAYTSNLSNKVNLYGNTLYLFVSRKFLPESDLKLLDLVKVMLNKSDGAIEDMLKGKYLITSKNIIIQQKGFTQRLGLSRDFQL